jgi:hypothetical protein
MLAASCVSVLTQAFARADLDEQATPMQAQFAPCNTRGVYNIVSVPVDHKTTDVCYVSFCKTTPDGRVECYKACIVAKGHTQKIDIGSLASFGTLTAYLEFLMQPTTMHYLPISLRFELLP